MTDSPVFHPQPDEHGQPVHLRHPSTPSDIAAWHDPVRRATVTPLGALPGELNGIAFAPWLDTPLTSAGWNEVDGQADIVEPAFLVPPGKAAAAGVVIEEAGGRIWAVSPSNRFGGYDATFPKGRVDPGVALQANAIREAFEESGLRVEIVAFLADSARTQTFTRYYLARRIGGNPALMGWESQAVHLAPLEGLAELLCNPNDQAVIAALMKVRSLKK
ncbi:NUDIX hydrolase [Massilia sp.]|uniref:NUDIX hydrolase n=1 Tax=Massilia sp. TaxID=1882437 RepID=UPI00289B8AAC|nr:NUDIX hydrolase [Massilia sp.]